MSAKSGMTIQRGKVVVVYSARPKQDKRRDHFRNLWLKATVAGKPKEAQPLKYL